MTKKNFILDDCVFINAAKLSDSKGNQDTCSLAAITNIIDKCHSLVFTYKMEREYFKKIGSLKGKKELKIDISSLLIHASLTEGKLKRMNDDLESVADEHLIHKNDVNLLRLARISRGIIVTSDGRLLKALKDHDFETKYGVKFLQTKDVQNHV